MLISQKIHSEIVIKRENISNVKLWLRVNFSVVFQPVCRVQDSRFQHKFFVFNAKREAEKTPVWLTVVALWKNASTIEKCLTLSMPCPVACFNFQSCTHFKMTNQFARLLQKDHHCVLVYCWFGCHNELKFPRSNPNCAYCMRALFLAITSKLSIYILGLLYFLCVDALFIVSRVILSSTTG